MSEEPLYREWRASPGGEGAPGDERFAVRNPPSPCVRPYRVWLEKDRERERGREREREREPHGLPCRVHMTYRGTSPIRNRAPL